MAGYGRIFSTASNYWNLLSSRSVLPSLQQCAMLKGKALEKLGFPPKPKKPMSIFFKFMKQERAKSEFMNSTLSSSEKIKILSKKWSEYDTKEKEALRREYDLEMLAYSKQMMTYEQSITPEQKKILADTINLQKEKAEKNEKKKKCSDLGKPKRPPTGFLQFLQENKYQIKSKDVKRMEYIREMAAQWKAMSSEEKSKYTMESNRLMVQYKQDMREWEENMVKRGHFDVVRNRGLMDIKSNNQPNAQ